RLDDAALPSTVPALEHDADLGTLVYDPLLQLDELDVECRELALIILALQSPVRLLVGAAFLALRFHGVNSRWQLGIGRAFGPGEEQPDVAGPAFLVVQDACREFESTWLQTGFPVVVHDAPTGRQCRDPCWFRVGEGLLRLVDRGQV